MRSRGKSESASGKGTGTASYVAEISTIKASIVFVTEIRSTDSIGVVLPLNMRNMSFFKSASIDRELW